MVIMNNVLAAFFVLFCLSRDSESCFTRDHYEYLKIPTGSSFYKECRCAEPGSGRLRWLNIDNKDISLLRPGTKSNVYIEWQDKDSVSLFISSMSKSVSGIYKCVTENNGQEHSLTYEVDAYDRPYFIHTKEIQYLIDRKDSTIICEARGSSNLIITWHKEQILIEPDVKKYEIAPNGLTIKNVSDEDKGAYKCTALDPETGEGIDTDIRVEVVYMPIIEELVPAPDKIVTAGSSLMVECKANGMPHPEYSWRKVINTESEKYNITWEEVTNRIIFSEIEPDDRGTYECIASNMAGNVTAQIEIEVLESPVITEFENKVAVEGITLQVICKAAGRPRPNVTIDFEADISEDAISNIFTDIKYPNETETELYLTFINISRANSGIYICNASNEVEMVSSEMTISVMYKPYFEEESEVIWGWSGLSVTLNCEHDSNPPATVNWKYQGYDIPTQKQVEINDRITENLVEMPLRIDEDTMFGIYECTAVNEHGKAKKYITLNKAYPPTAVKNVSILDRTSLSITFEIEGPEIVIGPEVLGFMAEYDESENYNITDIHINRTWSKDRPFKIDKLKPNTTYDIKFAAVNAVGVGPWSEIIKFVTLEKSMPEEITWESDSETAASEGVLKWKTPEDNGEPIDYYAVRYCPINNGTTEEVECKEERINPTTEFQLNRMDANTTYYFEILAHNSLGNSSAANIYVTIPAREEQLPLMSAGALIGIAVVVVLICLIVVDVILFVWRRQGIIASCCHKKNKKRLEDNLHSRDKKGLLKDNGESVASDSPKRSDRGDYKHTGIITGKHSAV